MFKEIKENVILMNEQIECLNRETETYRREPNGNFRQSTVAEMKNTQEELYSTNKMTKVRVRELEDNKNYPGERTKGEIFEEKETKPQRPVIQYQVVKHTCIPIPERRERERGRKKIFFKK